MIEELNRDVITFLSVEVGLNLANVGAAIRELTNAKDSGLPSKTIQGLLQISESLSTTEAKSRLLYSRLLDGSDDARDTDQPVGLSSVLSQLERVARSEAA